MSIYNNTVLLVSFVMWPLILRAVNCAYTYMYMYIYIHNRNLFQDFTQEGANAKCQNLGGGMHIHVVRLSDVHVIQGGKLNPRGGKSTPWALPLKLNPGCNVLSPFGSEFVQTT